MKNIMISKMQKYQRQKIKSFQITSCNMRKVWSVYIRSGRRIDNGRFYRVYRWMPTTPFWWHLYQRGLRVIPRFWGEFVWEKTHWKGISESTGNVRIEKKEKEWKKLKQQLIGHWNPSLALREQLRRLLFT